MNQNLSDALRAVAAALQTPVIVILLLLIAVTVVMLGTLIAELFTERLHMRAKLPELLNALQKKERPLGEIIENSGLIAAAAATVISAVRKRWYVRYMGQLGSVMECLLEAMEDENETA